MAVASALSAFGSWSLIRGLALSLLAAVAIAYSLTSELALVAGTRGDLAAKRASAVEQNEGRHLRIAAAREELSTLAPSRTVAEVRADITKLLAENPKSGNCSKPDGPVSRSVCPTIAALNAEIARAERRAELQATIAKLTEVLPVGVVKSADPASSALTTYLATLGITVSASMLSEWLVLVPVLALEVGAALAMVLVQSVSGPQPALPTTQDEHKADTEPAQRADSSLGAKDESERTPVKARKRTRDRGDKGGGGQSGRRLGNVVDLLKARGGQVSGGQRGIAKTLGLSKSRVNEVLHELAAAGAVRLTTSRTGTWVALVA